MRWSPSPSAPLALKGPASDFGLGFEVDAFEIEVAITPRIDDADGAMRDRDLFKPEAAGDAGLGQGQRQAAVRGEVKRQPRRFKPRLDEIDLAAQQRRGGELQPQLSGGEGDGRVLGADLDILNDEIGAWQQLKVDGAANFRRRAQRLGQARFDQAALGAPVDKIGADQRGGEDDDQGDGENGQAVAQFCLSVCWPIVNL